MCLSTVILSLAHNDSFMVDRVHRKLPFLSACSTTSPVHCSQHVIHRMTTTSSPRQAHHSPPHDAATIVAILTAHLHMWLLERQIQATTVPLRAEFTVVSRMLTVTAAHVKQLATHGISATGLCERVMHARGAISDMASALSSSLGGGFFTFPEKGIENCRVTDWTWIYPGGGPCCTPPFMSAAHH